jgi:ABC-type bacteriocin/lantibiotic exporter with double-glycine peptidase domain
MTPIASLNVPHFKQEQGGSCTAACVRMVLAHHSRAHSEDEIRQRALSPTRFRFALVGPN